VGRPNCFHSVIFFFVVVCSSGSKDRLTIILRGSDEKSRLGIDLIASEWGHFECAGSGSRGLAPRLMKVPSFVNLNDRARFPLPGLIDRRRKGKGKTRTENEYVAFFPTTT